jgi:hypothetical protein
VGTRGTRKKRKKLMHDQVGRKLEVDDIVLIPAVVTKLYDDEDYCNVELKTLFGRRPDDAYEKFGAMNTAVVLRCNDVVDLLGLGWTSIPPAVSGQSASDVRVRALRQAVRDAASR